MGALRNFIRHASLASVCAASLAVPAWASNANAKAPASVDWCQRFSDRLASVSLKMCQQSALAPTGAISVQGFPIVARQIPAIKPPKDRKQPIRVLLLGGIHGDELTSPAIVFKWMQWMHMAPAHDFHWSVAPVVNPDGFLSSKARRMNANGVDLNRNFPTPHWHKEAPHYWTKRTGRDPRRFPGKEPLSEPESRWVDDEITRFKPDVIISVHAPFGVLDFDGPVQPPRNFGRLVFTPVGVYPGSLGNYSGVHKKVPIITIELPNAGAMPTEAESKRIWEDMLAWIQKNVPPQPMAPRRQPAIAAK